MSDLLLALVRVSEKAANIARACRQEETLFSQLIQKKQDVERNNVFVADFKTLADVLVQEVIKHDIGKQFSDLKDHIYGEETNEFKNELGEKIQVRMFEDVEDTARLLSKVLGGNMRVAEVLAVAAHQDVPITDLQTDSVDIPIQGLGLWVDPIDSTYQYIKGISDALPVAGLYSQGLQCVTVLIGVYDLQTGLPVMGVMNQPFVTLDPMTNRWTGQYFWGISSGSINLSSVTPAGGGQKVSAPPQESGLSAVLSPSDSEHVRTLLQQRCEGRVNFSAGAGYKCLCVILGLSDVYVYSQDATYRWDCCAPHAILRSLGGGIANLRECLRLKHAGTKEEWVELVYNTPVEGVSGPEKWANKGGLVAYRSKSDLEAVLSLLSMINL